MWEDLFNLTCKWRQSTFLLSLILYFLSAVIINRWNHLNYPSSYSGKQNRPSRCHRWRCFTGNPRPSWTHNRKSNECTTEWLSCVILSCYRHLRKGLGCVLKCVFWMCFCFPSGQSATKGAEFEADGGFHVQCAEATGIRRGFPLALPVYRLIIMLISHCFFPDNLNRVDCADFAHKTTWYIEIFG